MDVPVFDFTQPLEGKRIVLRASLNVPVEQGKVTNLFRLEQALPTIELLAKKGARVVVLAHIGREKTNSLKPVWQVIKDMAHVPVLFSEDVVGVHAQKAVANLQNGEVLLLENVRKEQRELENDEDFAKALAGYGEMYINDAFADAHRAHASIVGVPHYIPGFLGPLFQKEMRGIDPARNPTSPSLAIIGGAKFVTKEPLVRHLIATYDYVFIGGAIANDFIKAKGYNVGRSLVSNMCEVRDLLTNSKIHIPEYVVVGQGHGEHEEKHIGDIEDHEIIYDIGSKSLEKLAPLIDKAGFILWNGPLGFFEGGYKQATEDVAKMIADTKGHTIIGGGNTVEAVQKYALHAHFTHVSTSGGAMLKYIADGTLVGIEALGD